MNATRPLMPGMASSFAQFGSFDDPIALSCSVDPAGPMCSSSDPRVTPGAAATEVTLTVGTSGVAHLRMPGSTMPLFAFWIALPAFGLLVAGTRSRGRNNTKKDVVLALVLLGLLGWFAACGGSGGGGGTPTPPVPPSPPQQSKTYTITVVGTGRGISQSTTTSLTVTY